MPEKKSKMSLFSVEAPTERSFRSVLIVAIFQKCVKGLAVHNFQKTGIEKNAQNIKIARKINTRI